MGWDRGAQGWQNVVELVLGPQPGDAETANLETDWWELFRRQVAFGMSV